MQLPRGTFRSIRKRVKLGDILRELASLRFTGIGTLSSAEMTGALVFRNGECILAKIQNDYGDPAWDAARAHQDDSIDIALSDIDNAQLQLALDFNKKARVTRTGNEFAKPVPSPQTAAPAAITNAEKRTQPHQKQQKDPVPVKTIPSTRPQPEYRAAPEKSPDISFEKREISRTEPPAEPVQTPGEEDLNTMENMDLDEVAQKIRKDCKTILKQLQLDHLAEK